MYVYMYNRLRSTWAEFELEIRIPEKRDMRIKILL